MLGCLPSASVDHASLARHSCLQASSVLFWLWLTLATGGQCCPGQPGTALLQAAHSLQVFAADCAAAVRCSPAVTGVSASEWAVWPHASAAACVSVCSADGAACVPASPKAHLQLVDNWSPAVAWHTPGHPTCPVSLLFCCAQSSAPISSPVPCSMALPVLHTPRVLYCSWTAMQRLVSGPHPGRCTHWILPALQLDSNQRCQNVFCARPCRHFMPCVPQLDSHAEVSRSFGPGPRGHLMPCVLQLDSDAEVSDSLGMGTEGASQSHTAPYSQTPADSLGAARGQDDRDYHPVLGDDVTSRGAGKRAYGTRSKGRRAVRHCPRAGVVLAAVMLLWPRCASTDSAQHC